MTTPEPTDMIRELTQTHRHSEPYTHEANGTTYTQRHHVTVPALLDQLQHATPLTGGDDRSGSGYGSRPVASLEALDTLVRIDLESARWLRDLGLDDPGDTKDCVRLAGSLLPQVTTCTTTPPRPGGCCLPHDITRWWHQARIVSGWDVAAWKPNNTCPLCGKRGTLRIRPADHAALCVDCRSTWDPNTISLLAEHIRAENHDQAEAEPEPA